MERSAEVEQAVNELYDALQSGDGGEWKTPQSHVSIGVPNEESMGQELPT